MDKLSDDLGKDLPEGTVTFLFTDIEGSTKLLHRLGDEYTKVLADQRRILRAAFDQHHGREIDTQGDAFFASFARATDAVTAVADIQRALVEHHWPGDVQVRVRMGLHTGEPWLVEEGYVGMDVHRAARVGHAGHGGQVLLSETTTALIRDDLPEGVSLLDLGYHLLKDMRRPEQIHQLVIEGLASEFPAIKSLEALPSSASAGEIDALVKRDVGSCPYRGLAAFQEHDAPFFFGRESFAVMLEESVQTQNLVAIIVGPSGSGKSSVVFAGLLPKLKNEPGWLTVQIRPGSSPYLSLAGALTPLLEGASSGTQLVLESSRLAAALQSGEVALSSLVERILAQDPISARFLLVIDQFEELFTLTRGAEERRAFLAKLLASAGTEDSSRPSCFKLLLTLRADFMGQALAYRPFADALQDGSLMLGPMNREELTSAIEKPAELQGAAFETGLVERLLSDVGAEPGNLPLLEFALTLLWERMDMGWMTHSIYDEIGRVDGALARYAEEVFLGLDQRGQDETRRVFIQLVQPGEGTEDTRRVATRAELVGVDWDLVQYLADKRLVVTGLSETGVETVEVVHETLIRSWDRLRDWIDTDRAFRSWQEGLRANLRQWEAAGRDEGALLRGVPLAQAEAWLSARKLDLSLEEIDFIQTSLQHSIRIQARRDRRRRTIIAALAVGLLLALLLSVFAFSQRGEAVSESQARATQQAIAEAESRARATQQSIAEEEADGRATQQALAESEWARAEAESLARATQQAIAEDAVYEIATQQAITEAQAREALARNLAASALDNLKRDPQLSMLLAQEAANQTYLIDGTLLPEAQAALYQTIQDVSRLAFTIPPQDVGLPYINYTPDGSRIVARYFEEGTDPRYFPIGTSTLIWDAYSGELLHTLPEGIAVDAVPNTRYLGIVDAVERELVLTLWDPIDGTARPPIYLDIPESMEADGLSALMLSPDAASLIVVWQGGRLSQNWDLEDVIETRLNNLWDWDLGDISIEIGGRGFFRASVPSYATMSSDGSRFYTLHLFQANPTTQLLAIRNTMTGGVVRTFQVSVRELGIYEPGWSLSPDDSMAAFITDNYVDIQDFETGESLTLLRQSEDTFHKSVAFSSDSSMLAAATADGIIKIWDVSNLSQSGAIRQILTLADPGVSIYDMQFSPDGRWLATAMADSGAIKVWDIGSGGGMKLPFTSRETSEEDQERLSIACSPDGKQMVVSAQSGISSAYGLEGLEKLFQLDVGGSGQIEQLDYSPDGTTIATCRFAGPFQVWDADSGTELFRLDDVTEGGCSFDYHPDSSSVFLGFLKNGTGWHQELALPKFEPDILIEASPLRSYDWLSPHEGASISIAFDEQTPSLAVVSAEGELFIWDPDVPYGGTEGRGSPFDSDPNSNAALLMREDRGYLDVLFDPIHDYLIVIGIDGSITIIDSQRLRIVKLIDAHEGQITAAVLSLDGSMLATSGLDRIINLWNTDTGDLLLSLVSQKAVITDLEFTPDGTRLYAAGADGTIRPYVLDVDELMTMAQSHVSRSLTNEECRQYLHMDACPIP